MPLISILVAIVLDTIIRILMLTPQQSGFGVFSPACSFEGVSVEVQAGLWKVQAGLSRQCWENPRTWEVPATDLVEFVGGSSRLCFEALGTSRLYLYDSA